MNVIQEGSPMLSDLGRMFESVGLCGPAVAAHLKAGNVQARASARIQGAVSTQST